MTVKITTHSLQRDSIEINQFIDEGRMLGPILLLGAPGVGKGTQARELARISGLPHISTGEILRANVAEGTYIGRTATEIMNRGELVPDVMVNEMVGIRLQDADTSRGFILDGFPRTLEQALWLSTKLAIKSGASQAIAICISAERSQLIRRITGRRYCPKCQANFNVYLNPPEKEGLCDVDRAGLRQRADDTEKALVIRFQEYEALTAPVVSLYRERGTLVEIDGDESISRITVEIIKAVRNIRSASRTVLSQLGMQHGRV